MVQVACANLGDMQGLQAVERYVGHPIEANAAEADSLQRAIQRVFRDSLHSTAAQNMASPGRIRIGEAVEGEDADEVIALGDEIFHAALIREATDIHIEPADKVLRVRFRADGQLEEYRELPMSVHGALLSRLKVISGMDIAEKRAPQDGRFTLNTNQDLPIDVRTATIPTKHGERITMRLLATRAHELTLEKLGLLPAQLQDLQRNLQRPNGLILLTGPTGCGKSTTLYGAIRHLIADRLLNIITIEDPVEYLIDGISQVEVDLADKVSFHKALRSALRHDPDVLMIGEIRDQETAEIATKAALTGHLVFSTLHTNSAISSIFRLLEMGVKPIFAGLGFADVYRPAAGQAVVPALPSGMPADGRTGLVAGAARAGRYGGLRSSRLQILCTHRICRANWAVRVGGIWPRIGGSNLSEGLGIGYVGIS